MPGYGYSAVSKQLKEQWQINLEKYLLNRSNLVCLIHFIDSRHPIQKNDFQMREWINAYNLETITILTKSDLISRNDLNKRIHEVEKTFNTNVFHFSKNDSVLAKIILKELLSDKYKAEE